MNIETMNKSISIKPINNINYNDTKDNFDDYRLLRLFEKVKEKIDREDNRIFLNKYQLQKNKKI